MLCLLKPSKTSKELQAFQPEVDTRHGKLQLEYLKFSKIVLYLKTLNNGKRQCLKYRDFLFCQLYVFILDFDCTSISSETRHCGDRVISSQGDDSHFADNLKNRI